MKAHRQGPAEGALEDGHLDHPELPRRADLRGGRPRAARSSPATSPARRRGVGGVGLERHRGDAAARQRGRARGRRARRRRPLPVPRRGRAPRLEPRRRSRSCSARCATRATRRSARLRARSTRPRRRRRRCAACSSCAAGDADPARRGRAVERDRAALRDGRHVAGSISSEAHETLAIAMNRLGGALEHRRGRRGSRALDARRERRPAPLGDQAGRLRAVRRDDRLPRRRRPAADQGLAGREARRGRPAARLQGQRPDRQAAALDAGRRPDLASAAPRHLLDRGSRAADLRPAHGQPERLDQRQAGRRGRSRHRRRRRRQGARPTTS